MNCSCTVTSIEEEGYYTERIRKAAKPSTCPECGITIKKGEEYIFTTMFSEGRIHNHKMCASCGSIVKQFYQDGYYCGSILEDLESYIDTVWVDDLPSNCISKLHPRAKSVVCDMLQRYQEKEETCNGGNTQ